MEIWGQGWRAPAGGERIGVMMEGYKRMRGMAMCMMRMMRHVRGKAKKPFFNFCIVYDLGSVSWGLDYCGNK